MKIMTKRNNFDIDVCRLENKNTQKKEIKRELNSEEIKNKIAEIVFNARKKRGITQKQLAELIGTSQATVSSIESGKRGPSGQTLFKIAIALKYEIVFKEREKK